MIRNSVRPGVTLFQLLIVIAILAILLALFLPATVQIRLAAARAQSQNNIKQIGLAVHSYHDAHNAMPAGVSKNGYSAHAVILPYIEQDNLYRLLDLEKTPVEKANPLVRNTRIKTYMNPADNVMPMIDSGPTSYFFSAGSKAELKDNDGIFYPDSKASFNTITDGTSNTIMVGESLRGDGGVRAMTVARQHVALKADALKTIKPETGVDDWKNDTNIAANRGSAWIEGKFLQTLFTATRPFNDDKPDVDCGGIGGLSTLRSSLGGGNVGFMDGSVRYLKANVDFRTFQALCTRAGGEVVNID